MSISFKISNPVIPEGDGINPSKLYFTYPGGFGPPSEFLTTFFCAKKIADLKDDLITFESLVDQKDWPVSKILQREIDKKRVKEIINKYILAKDKLKYFPPLTVALLPRDKDQILNKYIKKNPNSDYSSQFYKNLFDNNQELRSFFENNYSEFEKFNDESKAEGLIIKRGQIHGMPFSILNWDNNKFHAVIIDGQHRFFSLVEASKQNKDIDNFTQEVVFIDASSKYFDLSSKGGNITPVKLFRKVFIDINRTPAIVSTSKQIIMDDMDVVSLFVQAVVDDDQDSSDMFLPPQIIDWHTPAEKYELPYLTSIIQLKDILLNYFLDKASISSFNDLKSKDKVQNWYDTLQSRFLIDEAIEQYNLKKDNRITIDSLRKSVEVFVQSSGSAPTGGEIEFEDVFYYDTNVLSVAQSKFNEIYRNGFILFFKNIRPYKKALDWLTSEKVFDKDLVISKVLVKKKENLKHNEQKDILDPLKVKANSALNPEFEIFHFVVGQKALFNSYFKYLLKNLSNKDNESVSAVTKEYLNKANAVFDYLNSNEIYLFGNFESRAKMSYREYVKKSYKAQVDVYEPLANDFWDDFLYFDKNINYNSVGVKAISNTLDLLIECLGKTKSEYKSMPFPELKKRMKIRLEQKVTDGEFESESVKEYINMAVEAKNNFLRDRILKLK